MNDGCLSIEGPETSEDTKVWIYLIYLRPVVEPTVQLLSRNLMMIKTLISSSKSVNPYLLRIVYSTYN